jgi:hypothetical protein
MMKTRMMIMRLPGIIGIMILLSLIGTAGAAGVTVSVADTSIGTGGSADVPVTISGADRLGGMDLTVTYDPAVLKYTGVKQGDLTKNGLIEAKEAEPGRVNIGFINAAGISGDGTLLTLGFTATGAKGTSSPVTVVNRGGFTTSHLDVPATVNSGTVTVTGQNPLPVGTETITGALVAAVLLAGYRQKKA